MGMALDEPKDNEQPFHIDGIDVLVEDFVRPIVDGTTIDYVDNPDGKGFIITNRDAC
jgi:Fe-S cluster assembly iron-binding protein IscA